MRGSRLFCVLLSITSMTLLRTTGLGRSVFVIFVICIGLTGRGVATSADAFEGSSKRERRPSWHSVAKICDDNRVRDRDFVFQLRQHYENPTCLDYLHLNDLVGERESFGATRSPFFDTDHEIPYYPSGASSDTSSETDTTMNRRIDWCSDVHPLEKWTNKAFGNFARNAEKSEVGRWALRNILEFQRRLDHAAYVLDGMAEDTAIGQMAVRTMCDFGYEAEKSVCQAQKILKPAINKYRQRVSRKSKTATAATTVAAANSYQAVATDKGRRGGVRPKQWLQKTFPLLSVVARALNPGRFVNTVSTIATGTLSRVEDEVRSYNIRVAFHNFCRDSGLFRALVDFMTAMQAPVMAANHRWVFPEFMHLSKRRTHIQYGTASKAQQMDMYLPDGDNPPRGLVFFVHGGAWGSGMPWIYRLVASPFLKRGLAVAIVGYRTYPNGNAQTQVEDLELASSELTRRYPQLCQDESELGVHVVGHSSGAHISLLMMAERMKKQMDLQCQSLDKPGYNSTSSSYTAPRDDVVDGQMRVDSFVGISGPYDVSSHFDFEAARGLEELSPMKPVCGFTRSMFRHFSPTLRLSDVLTGCSDAVRSALDNSLPNMALVHGVEDDTVPFSSTSEAGKLLRTSGVSKCEEIFLADTGHADTVLELMLGGKTQDIVVGWVERGLSQAKNHQEQFDDFTREGSSQVATTGNAPTAPTEAIAAAESIRSIGPPTVLASAIAAAQGTVDNETSASETTAFKGALPRLPPVALLPPTLRAEDHSLKKHLCHASI